MGLFKNMKAAMDQAGGLGAMTQGMGSPGQMMADRDSIQGQAQEFRRIRGVGQPGNALIRSHVDTGEKAAGNPIWVFDLEVTPQGGAPYSVQHREIVSTAALGAYGDGTSMACRIDPADPQKIAFGE
jgi:hypothetical protein